MNFAAKETLTRNRTAIEGLCCGCGLAKRDYSEDDALNGANVWFTAKSNFGSYVGLSGHFAWRRFPGLRHSFSCRGPMVVEPSARTLVKVIHLLIAQAGVHK